ncbi:MAG: response regulator [Clostridiales bacterium]|jgi:signal transduction histidine kinase/DNA-binding response OmpR family regulator|nr:response regulator [Clostridiales bacterium]
MTDRIIDSIDAFVYVIDPVTYEILYANKKLADAFAPRGLLGRVCWQAMHGGLSGPCAFCLRHRLEPGGRGDALAGHGPHGASSAGHERYDGASASYERYDGSTGRYYRYSAQAIEWEGGRRAHAYHVCDVTEAKFLAEQGSSAKNDFMSRMSHELRTPINAILGLSRIAGATDDLFKIRSCLLKIVGSSKQLMSIINDVLDMSRIEAGELRISPTGFKLEKMLIDVSGGVIGQINEKAQDFQVVIDRDVPRQIRADEPRLSQIVANLLTNASKFTHDKGTIKLHVSLGRGAGSPRGAGVAGGASGAVAAAPAAGDAAGETGADGAAVAATAPEAWDAAGKAGAAAVADGAAVAAAAPEAWGATLDAAAAVAGAPHMERIVFSVADSGIGISPAGQRRLFAPFEQLDGSKSRRYGGTGLGLSICKRLVEMMGGEISVRSAEGEGSTFSFYIDAEAAAPDGAGETPIKNSLQKGVRVLYVDHSEDTRAYFMSLMDENDIQAKAAESGFAALDSIEGAIRAGSPFTIVFIDWRMPLMNGIETARLIRERHGGFADIVLVSNVEWALIERAATEAGIARFIAKPLFASIIIDTINEIVGVRERSGARARGGQLPDFSSKRILLAEDVQINRDIISACLGGTGVAIDCAENGLAALNMFRGAPDAYDLILMDIEMPEMNGCDATVQIRSLPHPKAKSVPILALTAELFGRDISRCLGAGMDGHLRKPISGDAVLDKLSEYLSPGAGARVRSTGAGEGGADAGARGADAGCADAGSAATGAGAGKAAGGRGGGLATAATAAGGGPESESGGDGAAFARFLPYIDAAEALPKLKNNKKLYALMLRNAKGTKLCGNLLDALRSGDLGKIVQRADTLLGVAANLSLAEIEQCAMQIKTTAQRRLLSQELAARYQEAVERTFDIIDELASHLEEGT